MLTLAGFDLTRLNAADFVSAKPRPDRVAIFAVVDNVMSVLQVNPFLKDVVRGVVIVVAVAVYARRSIVKRPPRFGHGQPEEPAMKQEVAA